MLNRPRILNVDDDEIGRFAVTQMLRASGFDVDEAATGREALAKAESLPDIILLDVRMPDLDGFEVCRRIKANAKTAGITVVHMSATQVDSQAIAHGLNWGADGYLTEPVNQAELVATLRAFLRIRQSERSQRFLAEASRELSSVLEADEVLAKLAQLTAAFFGELCSVDKLDDAGQLHDVSTLRRGATLRAAREFKGSGQLAVAQSRQARHGVLEDRAQLARAFGFLDVAGLEDLLPCSYLSVPLIARNRSLGVISVAARADERQYGARDLGLLEDLAAHGALLVDNARLYEQAQKAIATRENLLAVVSHDLKDPLNSVLMSCELMYDAATEPQARRRLEIMRRGAMRMDHLIHDLLDLASLDAGTFSVNRQPCDARQLIDDVLESFSQTAAEKEIALSHDVKPPLPPLSCDRERLHQVLSNLLSNAIKFTPKAGRVTLRVKRVASSLVFTIDDSGPGIAADQLPYVFDRFWQANRTRRLGTGLGLSIAKGIVEAHGGVIRARSELGVGSTFEFELPAQH
ncbi:MAG TPA: hybrid sensor histidine kinase/response regulator [Polyangiales bacterium]|nr:hybrid sensor histidine kinase/response regulator [Polyangiales bacterium]